MAHAVELADRAYQVLLDTAHARGMTPQQLLEAWLLDLQAHDAAGLEGYDPTKDPLAPFLGAFEADSPDVIARHDQYLAETFADVHTPR